MGSCVSSTTVKPKKEPPRSNQVTNRDESHKNVASPLSAWSASMDPSGLPTYFASSSFARNPFTSYHVPGGPSASAVQVYYIPEASVISLAPPYTGTALDLMRPTGLHTISGVSRVSRDPYWWVNQDWLPPAVPEVSNLAGAGHNDPSSSSAVRLASSPRSNTCADPLAHWQADGIAAKAHEGQRARGTPPTRVPVPARREPCYLLKLQSASDSLFDYLLASDHQKCSVPLDAIVVALPLALVPLEDGPAHAPSPPPSPGQQVQDGAEASSSTLAAGVGMNDGLVTPIAIRRRSHAHIRLEEDQVEEAPSSARRGRPASATSVSPRPSESSHTGLAALFDPNDSLSALLQSPSCAMTFVKFRPPHAATPPPALSPRQVEADDAEGLRIAEALMEELAVEMGTPPRTMSISSSPRIPTPAATSPAAVTVDEGKPRCSPSSPPGRVPSAGTLPQPPLPPVNWMGSGAPRTAPSLSPMPRQRLLEEGGLVNSPRAPIASRRASADCVRSLQSKWPEGDWQPPALLPPLTASRRPSSSARRSLTVPGGSSSGAHCERTASMDGASRVHPSPSKTSPHDRLLSLLREHAHRHEQQLMPAAPVPGGTTTLGGQYSTGCGGFAPGSFSSLARSASPSPTDGASCNKMVCGICWRMMHVEQHASLLPCGHVFHTQCLTSPTTLPPLLHGQPCGAPAANVPSPLEAGRGRQLPASPPTNTWRSPVSTNQSNFSSATSALIHRAARHLSPRGSAMGSPARGDLEGTAPSSAAASPGLRLLKVGRGNPPAPLVAHAPCGRDSGATSPTTGTSIFAHCATSSQSSTSPSAASRVPKAPSSVDLAPITLSALRQETSSASCGSLVSPTSRRRPPSSVSPRSSTPSVSSCMADLPLRRSSRCPSVGAAGAREAPNHPAERPKVDHEGDFANPNASASATTIIGNPSLSSRPAASSAADIPLCPLCPATSAPTTGPTCIPPPQSFPCDPSHP